MQLFKYFKRSDAWGMEIRTCGYAHALPHAPYPSGGHPGEYAFTWEQGRKLRGFHIVYIPSGCGTFQSGDGEIVKVNPGDMLFIYENEWHRYKPDAASGWEEYWIGWDGQYFRDHILRDMYPERKSFVRKVGFDSDILFAFDQLLMIAKRGTKQSNKILSGSMLALLGHVVEKKATAEKIKPTEKLLEESIFMIRQHFNQPLDLRKMAESFGMSYSGYRKLFRKHTGLPLNQYFIKEKLLLAQRMLKNTHLSMKEIAEKTGFGSAHYFSRLYKLKFGYSPSKERM